MASSRNPATGFNLEPDSPTPTPKVPAGNMISRRMGYAPESSDDILPDLVTMLYGRVIHKHQDVVQGYGNCSVVVLGEMYSPNLDAILSAGGLEVPIPGAQPEVLKHTVIKFTSVIRDAKEGLLLMAINSLSIIRGKELTLYHNMQFRAGPIVLPLPLLTWRTPFIYASKLKQQADEEAARVKKRVQLKEEEARKLAARQRRVATQSEAISTGSIMPKSFAVLLEVPKTPRPRLR